MALRTLDFSDGFTSASAPSAGTIQTSQLQVYANDAAFEAANGAGQEGDIYHNSTDDFIHWHDGTAWRVVTSNVGTQTLTNKSIDADTNTITNIENADIKSAAAIARTKLASGTASHVLINDGSGVMSSEATLAVTRGGTGQSSYTNGQLLIGNTTGNTLTKSTLTAGTGISITNGGGSITIDSTVVGAAFTMTAKTTTYTAVIQDYVTVTKASAWTLTLPTAVSQSGKSIRVLITDNTPGNALTINTTSSQTISGYASGALKMYTQYEFAEFTSDGTNWVISAHRTDTPWTAYTPDLAGFGTETNVAFIWRRQGANMEINGSFTTGTPSGEHQMPIPTGPLIDIASMTHSGVVGFGVSVKAAGGGNAGTYTTGRVADVWSDGSSTTTLYFVNDGDSATFDKATGAGWVDASTSVKIQVYGLPISGWGW